MVNYSQDESYLLGLLWSKYVKYSITDLHFLGNAFAAALHYDLKTSLKGFFFLSLQNLTVSSK